MQKDGNENSLDESFDEFQFYAKFKESLVNVEGRLDAKAGILHQSQNQGLLYQNQPIQINPNDYLNNAQSHYNMSGLDSGPQSKQHSGLTSANNSRNVPLQYLQQPQYLDRSPSRRSQIYLQS